MRRLIALALLAASCSQADSATRYLEDARFRRERLVASLVNPDNAYSRLRIAHYASGDSSDWDRLPEWNPPVATLTAGGPPNDDERPLDLASPTLGEDAFFRYPTQTIDLAAGSIGGPLVSERLPDGSHGLALTCATCHARVVGGVLVAGLANESLDLGWGAGMVDVSAPGDAPIAIPDLRTAALERYLQRDGTVRADGDPVTLAIRIETLISTSHAGAVRPPREIALALASFLATLAPPSATLPPDGSVAAAGAALFDERCSSCHVPPAYSGDIVPLDVIGTDPLVGESPDRGTGGYRVPSLRGVATRGHLLHDASVSDVAALLDPARTVPGHRFGLELSAAERDALVAFLSTL